MAREKNEEIAWYYTYAQLNEENAPLMEKADDLIELLQDNVDEDEQPSNLEKGLLKSLKDFKRYCQFAAEDLNGGINQSPNFALASKESKRILEGFDRMKKNAPNRYQKYQKHHENFVSDTRIMSAAQWIEQVKTACKNGEITKEDAVSRIFAIRNLAKAERGNRANIDKKYLAAEQINERAKQFGESQELRQFFRSNEKKLSGMVDKIGSRNHGGKMEDLFKDYAMKQKDSLLWDEDLFGRLLPDAQKQREFQREQDQKREQKRVAKAWNATQWIEFSQKRIENMEDLTNLDEPASNILAARMVADAQIGDRSNIDSKKMTGGDFKGVAERLRNSDPFREYLSELKKKAKESARRAEAERLAAINKRSPDDPAIIKAAKSVEWNIDKSLFTDGHGGRFETDFRNYLLKRPDVDELDPTLYGKFLKSPLKVEGGPENAPEQAVPSPKEAGDARYTTFKDYFEQNKYNADNTLSKNFHAAKMAAASDIIRNDPNAMFDRKTLENKARKYLKDPVFRMITRDPKILDSICGGNVPLLAKEVSQLRESCSEIVVRNGPFNEAFDKLKNMELPETAGILKSVTEYKRKSLDEDVRDKIAVVNAIIEFQDQFKDEKNGPKAEAVNESMKMLAEFVSGSSAQVYLDQQLKKVNDARGLKPKDEGYLGKDDVIAEVPEVDDDLMDGPERQSTVSEGSFYI